MALMLSDVRDKAVLDVKETADLLGFSKQQVYRAIHKEQLPHVRVGRKVLVPVQPLLQTLGYS